jgi:hypothetical protein
MNPDDLLAAVIAIEPGAAKRELCDRPAVNVPPGTLLKLMRKLHDDPQLAFDMLYTHYLMVAASLKRDKPEVSSVSSVWRVAEWHEREAYDMFGVLYDGHPDLRRLLLDDDWKGFPLRKDYKDDFMLECPQ